MYHPPHHVDVALQTDERGGGGEGDAVLTRARLGDEFLFAHLLGEERLAQAVVDLVRAGVVEVLALEVNLRPVCRIVYLFTHTTPTRFRQIFNLRLVRPTGGGKGNTCYSLVVNGFF